MFTKIIRHFVSEDVDLVLNAIEARGIDASGAQGLGQGRGPGMFP